MPIYDLICKNGHEQRDKYLKMGEKPPCPECGEPTDTLWDSPANVVGDDIPGGMWVYHGLCNEDGTPRKYYSKSEMDKEAAKRGLTRIVEHVTDPRSGSDKSKHTKRWY